MRLNNYLSSGVVFQCDEKINVNGSSSGGGTITLLFNDNIIESFKVDNGEFFVVFSALKKSKKLYKLIAKDDENIITIENIAIGEVILCAGQSNMSFDVDRSDVNNSACNLNGNVRVLNILSSWDKNGIIITSKVPLKEIEKNSWEYKDTCNLETSAIGITVANKLSKKLNSYVGLVCISAGGTTIDLWSENGGIYNQKICPLSMFSFKNFLWYHGESSAKDYFLANDYSIKLEKLLNLYRKIWSEKCNFILFEIACHNYNYDPFAVAYINEVIRENAVKIGADIVPIYNILPLWKDKRKKDYHPIHPIKKRQIANLACDILLDKYLNNENHQVSTMEKIEFHSDKCQVFFNCKEVRAKGKAVGFCVAGSDGVYYPADAEIENNSVVLSSKYVKNIVDVSYAFFLYNHICNVYNEYGKPLLEFRTTNENATNKRYCDYGAYHIKKGKSWFNGFSLECGGAYNAKLFYRGCGENSPIIKGNEFTFKEGFTTIRYECLNGYIDDWTRFSKLKLEYSGIAPICISFCVLSKRYLCYPISSGENYMIFNLKKVTDESGYLFENLEEMKYLNNREFVFNAKEKSTCKILNIEYYED